MNPDEIRRLYNAEYAASYNAKFLGKSAWAPDADYDMQMLTDLLQGQPEWLDVACGTGYFLRHFPAVPRTGMDLSPAMLQLARKDNPGCLFLERNYLEPAPEWTDRFGLVSCMWYAYGYVESMREVSQLIANLASWTSPSGVCFVPLADPELLVRQPVPHRVATGSNIIGAMFITGVIWSYVESEDADHRNMVAPCIPYMTDEFGRYFADVSVVRNPQTQRPALIARSKRSVKP